MPIPKPRRNEKKDKFLSRCMSSDVMIEDFDNQSQRFAVCNTQWEKHKDKDKEKSEEDKKMDMGIFNELIVRANKAMGKEETSKKLTTKDRKNLKKNIFCGPNRSFPVPDCKHVAVAKAFLSRSKFSQSTKKKIAACINRRAKSLGCSGDKKAKAYTEFSFETLDKECQKLYESSIFATTRELVEASIEDPGMDLADCDCFKDF